MNRHTQYEGAAVAALRRWARALAAEYSNYQDQDAATLALLMRAAEMEAEERGLKGAGYDTGS
jgi:hypothetical protein